MNDFKINKIVHTIDGELCINHNGNVFFMSYSYNVLKGTLRIGTLSMQVFFDELKSVFPNLKSIENYSIE